MKGVCMNLWQKSIDQITFEDVDGFCTVGCEESVRLDYKVNWPNDLAKTMAAMANTLGGMIILGVDSDKTTNKPIWPPVPPAHPNAALPTAPGLSERVYQVARDAIFPPVMPEVSPVLSNKKLPGYDIIVVRIPESKDAPHATEGKKAVYVYERTGNQAYGHSHADIEYIERLLNRRRTIEADRERMIQDAIQRGRKTIARSGCSYRWVSVLPYYPWRTICAPVRCHQFQTSRWSPSDIAPHCPSIHVQKAPNGSFAICFDPTAEKALFPVACASFSDRGHVFGMIADIEHTATGTQGRSICYEYVQNLVVRMVEAAVNFYEFVGMERPLYLQASLGILDARNYTLASDRTRPRFRRGPSYFPDDNFRADTAVLQVDREVKTVASPLLEQLRFGFDMDD